MDAFTPAQTTELLSRVGTKRSRMRIDKLWWNSFMGGMLLSFGCALSLSTTSSPWFVANAPGLNRTIGAFVFPVGLIMVVLTGADLFTSYVLIGTVAFLHRRISFLELLKTWVVSYAANLAGALFFTIVLVGYGGIFETGYYYTNSINFAVTKTVTPQWHQIFLRGILANWLVTMAVFLSTSAREVISKILAVWFPVMCFVGLGTDHVIANMFYMPLAIFNGSGQNTPLTVGYYIWKSMIPSCLGNIIGGGLFVGGMYWYLNLQGQDVAIHFDLAPSGTTLYTQGIADESRLIDSSSQARCGIAKDLAKELFEKEKSSAGTSLDNA